MEISFELLIARSDGGWSYIRVRDTLCAQNLTGCLHIGTIQVVSTLGRSEFMGLAIARVSCRSNNVRGLKKQ